jgi:recombination protein RecT
MSNLSTAAATKAVAQQKSPTIRDLVQAQQPAIEAQLAGAINSGAFVRAAISEISKSESLQKATPASVLGSVMLAAQLHLEIGPALGQFYLTPRQESFKDDNNQWQKRWTCLPIVGYQGLIELAYRSGRVLKIETFVVRKGDLFEYGANSERGRYFDWKPADFDQNREWTDIVVTAQIAGGGVVWETLPKEKILERRPQGWEKGPWKSNEVEMARKTLVREVSPYLPKSTEFGLAVQVTRQVEEQGAKVESIAGVHELVVTRDDGQHELVVPVAGREADADPDYVAPVQS